MNEKSREKITGDTYEKVILLIENNFDNSKDDGEACLHMLALIMVQIIHSKSGDFKTEKNNIDGLARLMKDTLNGFYSKQ